MPVAEELELTWGRFVATTGNCPLCGGFGVSGVVFWRAPPSVESGAYRGAKTLEGNGNDSFHQFTQQGVDA